MSSLEIANFSTTIDNSYTRKSDSFAINLSTRALKPMVNLF